MTPPSTGIMRTIGRAEYLPSGWDGLCHSLLQTRSLLEHYEQTNPCGQRYHAWFVDGKIVAGAVTYDFELDLLTFFKGARWPVRATLIGLPASIPPGGLVGQTTFVRQLLPEVLACERGFVVALNLRPDQVPATERPLRLLPDMVFRGRFASLTDYEQSLRSPWRRRMGRIRHRFAQVDTVRTDCRGFTSAHHDLYLQVRERADAGLETLGLDFFRGLPGPFELVSHYAGGRLICWRIVLVEGPRATFVLGGHDYQVNDRYQAYFNNLYSLLDDAFWAGVSEIDLGQTAEDPKGRLGALPVETRMLLHHGRPWLDRLIRLVSPLLAYRDPCSDYRVFRREVPTS